MSIEARNNSDSVSANTHITLELARSLRVKRANTAKQLLALLQSVDSDSAQNVMQSMTYSLLDDMPEWCALSEASLKEMQRITAALYLAPAFKACIDGACLLSWRELLGASVFDHAMESSLPNPSDSQPVLPDVNDSVLLDIGSCILRAGLASHPARALYAGSTMQGLENVATDYANDMSNHAYQIFSRAHQVQSQVQSAAGNFGEQPVKGSFADCSGALNQ